MSTVTHEIVLKYFLDSVAIGAKLSVMSNMKILPIIAAGDAAADAAVTQLRDDVTDMTDQLRADLDDEVERLVSRLRVVEMAYVDAQRLMVALRCDLGELECRVARLEKGLPAGSYEAKKGIPEG